MTERELLMGWPTALRCAACKLDALRPPGTRICWVKTRPNPNAPALLRSPMDDERSELVCYCGACGQVFFVPLFRLYDLLPQGTVDLLTPVSPYRFSELADDERALFDGLYRTWLELLERGIEPTRLWASLEDLSVRVGEV